MQGNILNKIKADDIEEVYTAISQLAAEWAISGYILQSNQLLETLWLLHLPHSQNQQYLDQGFQFLWCASQRYPHFIPFALENLEKIEKENVVNLIYPYRFVSSIVDNLQDKEWESLSNQELMMKAFLLAYDAKAPNFLASPHKQLAALAAMEKFVQDAMVHSGNCDLYVFIIVLSLNNNLRDKAVHYLIKWAQACKTSLSFIPICNLTRNQKIAELLLEKHIAHTLEIDENNFQNQIDKIADALNARLKDGRTLIYGHFSWRKLLEQISILAIEEGNDRFDDNVKQSGWLGTIPATKKEIKQTEKRLGIALPKEYKEFLQTTNGFTAPDSVGVTLAPVQKIDWLKNVDDSYLDWYAPLPDDEEFQALSKKIKTALYIGGFAEEQHLFLIPSAAKENWECWFFAFWTPGETIYQNVRFYFEYVLEFLKMDI